jgi:F-type H+-transporting ATPase subunit a
MNNNVINEKLVNAAHKLIEIEDAKKAVKIIEEMNELWSGQMIKKGKLTIMDVDNIERIIRIKLEKGGLGRFYQSWIEHRNKITPNSYAELDESNWWTLSAKEKAERFIDHGWSAFDHILAHTKEISTKDIGLIADHVAGKLEAKQLNGLINVNTFWAKHFNNCYEKPIEDAYILGNRYIKNEFWLPNKDINYAIETMASRAAEAAAQEAVAATTVSRYGPIGECLNNPETSRFTGRLSTNNKSQEIMAHLNNFRNNENSVFSGAQMNNSEGHNNTLNSPMDQFEIKPFLGDFLGLSHTPIGFISNILVYIGLVVIFISLFFVYGTFKNNIKMNGWSFSTEAIYMTIYNMVVGQIGLIVGLYFFTFIFVLFAYILFSNLVGLIPYNFATTAHLVSTLSMSSSIWFGVTIIGLVLHGIKFFTLFSPEGTPLMLVPLLALIELISYIAKGLSLGIRLGANLISGHLLLLILAGFGFLGLTATIGIRLTGGTIAIVLITAISGLELAIAGIQSYVYSILTSSYIKDSVSLH